jgi:hypothetical protein
MTIDPADTFLKASPTTGISFSLITLRVGLGKTFSRFTGANTRESSNGPKTSIPMHVRITREREFTVTGDNDFERKDRMQSVLPLPSMSSMNEAVESW